MNGDTNLGRKTKFMMRLVRVWLCFGSLLICSPKLMAKDSATIFDLYAYNDLVPTAEQVLGHSLGTDINWTADAGGTSRPWKTSRRKMCASVTMALVGREELCFTLWCQARRISPSSSR